MRRKDKKLLIALVGVGGFILFVFVMATIDEANVTPEERAEMYGERQEEVQLTGRALIRQIAIDEVSSDQYRSVSVDSIGEDEVNIIINFNSSGTFSGSWGRGLILGHMSDMIQKIDSEPSVGRVHRYKMVAYGTLVDQYGNESTAPVASILLEGEQTRRINWGNMHDERFYRLVQRVGSITLHPSLR